MGTLEYLSPSEDEAVAMAEALVASESDGIHGHARRLGRWLRAKAAGDEAAGARDAAVALVRAGCKHVFVTRGASGVLWARKNVGGKGAGPQLNGGSRYKWGGTGEEDGDVKIEVLPAVAVDKVVSTRAVRPHEKGSAREPRHTKVCCVCSANGARRRRTPVRHVWRPASRARASGRAAKRARSRTLVCRRSVHVATTFALRMRRCEKCPPPTQASR